MRHNSSVMSMSILSFFCMSQVAYATVSVDSYGQIKPGGYGSVLGKENNPGNSVNAQNNQLNPGQAKKDTVILESSNDNKGNKPEIAPKTGSIKTSPQNDKLILKYQSATSASDLGKDSNLETETDKIELEDAQFKQITSIRSKENAAYVIRNKVAAKSNFPLMVDLETNELIVTTPAGTKIVTVLPDKAVENMLAANVLDQLGGKGGIRWLDYQASQTLDASKSAGESDSTSSGSLNEAGNASESGQTETTDSSPSASPVNTPPEPEIDEADIVVELITTQDGTLAYELEGTKTERFLGFRNIVLKRVVIVSAETGELLAINQDLLTDILDLFSV
jgi:hypothetical protein